MVWLRTAQSGGEIARLALERNVDVIPLRNYSHRKQVAPAFQIGFAAVDAKSISKGIQILSRLIS